MEDQRNDYDNAPIIHVESEIQGLNGQILEAKEALVNLDTYNMRRWALEYVTRGISLPMHEAFERANELLEWIGEKKITVLDKEMD